MSRIASTLGRVAKGLGVVEGFREAPKAVTALASIPALGFAAEVAEPLGGTLHELATGEGAASAERGAMAQHALEQAAAARQRRLLRAQATNEAILAATNPRLYTELLIGRRIPRGAVPIGAPRTENREVLDTVTRLMAEGRLARRDGGI